MQTSEVLAARWPCVPSLGWLPSTQQFCSAESEGQGGCSSIDGQHCYNAFQFKQAQGCWGFLVPQIGKLRKTALQADCLEIPFFLLKCVPGSGFTNVTQLSLPAVMCSLKGENLPASQPGPRWHFLSSCQLLPGDPKCSLPAGDRMCGPALVSPPVSMALEIYPPSLQIGPLYSQGSGES